MICLNMCFWPMIKEKKFNYNYMKNNLGHKLELLIMFHLHSCVLYYKSSG